MACSQPLKQQLGLAVPPLTHIGLSPNVPVCYKSSSQLPDVWVMPWVCFWPKAAFAKTVSFLLLPSAPYLFSRCLSVIYRGAGQSGWPFLLLVHWPWLLWAEAAMAQSRCPHLDCSPPSHQHSPYPQLWAVNNPRWSPRELFAFHRRKQGQTSLKQPEGDL